MYGVLLRGFCLISLLGLPVVLYGRLFFFVDLGALAASVQAGLRAPMYLGVLRSSMYSITYSSVQVCGSEGRGSITRDVSYEVRSEAPIKGTARPKGEEEEV